MYENLVNGNQKDAAQVSVRLSRLIIQSWASKTRASTLFLTNEEKLTPISRIRCRNFQKNLSLSPDEKLNLLQASKMRQNESHLQTVKKPHFSLQSQKITYLCAVTFITPQMEKDKVPAPQIMQFILNPPNTILVYLTVNKFLHNRNVLHYNFTEIIAL